MIKVPKDKKSYQALAVGAELVGTVLGAAIIGSYVDKYFDKGGLITFGFIIIGFATYVTNLIRRSK